MVAVTPGAFPQPLACAGAMTATEQADYTFVAKVIEDARRLRLKYPTLADLADATVDDNGVKSTGCRLDDCVRSAALALRVAVEGGLLADQDAHATYPTAAPLQHDDVDAFLAACCVVGDYSVSTGDLYRAYQAFCARNGEVPRSPHAFSLTLLDRGILRLKDMVRCWQGLQLKEPAPGDREAGAQQT